MRRNGLDSTDKRKYKNDLILFLVLCAIALILAGGLAVFRSFHTGKNGLMVRVRQDGKSAYYRLDEDRRITLDSEKGKNVILIKEGEVLMEKADCPDKICVRHKPISGEEDGAIICLPHKVIIEINLRERK